MRRKIPTLTLALLIPVASACAPPVTDEPSPRAEASFSKRAAAHPAAPAPASSASQEPLVVFLGDSLTAGLGLAEAEAYPALVERALEKEGLPLRVLNAGVSGDTTAGGLSRLDWLLGQKPEVVVVGLGANDGLRALPLAETDANLREIVSRVREAGADVLLLGMRIPPNYGPYADDFAALYPRIAEELDVPFVPFLLEGVGGMRELNLEDGIHPNAEGQRRVAATVAPFLEEVLREPEGGEGVAPLASAK